MFLIQMTGLSGAGKTTLALAAQQQLSALGLKVEVIDGDEFRRHLCRDLGFSREDRIENIRRLGVVGLTLVKHGIITILAAINPYEEARLELECRDLVKTVYVSCSLETLKNRDAKGLYHRATLSPDHSEYLPQFTGISDPYEPPHSPHLTLHTDQESIHKSVSKLVSFIQSLLPSPVDAPGPTRPKALFIGRWQPFHNGHKWLIDNKLKTNVPVLIAVRDVFPDANNPFSTEQTIAMIRRVYAEIDDVEVMPFADIESINYGRTVGYEVNCFAPSDEVGTISASQIRNFIKNKDDRWKNLVDKSIHEEIYNHLSIFF